MARYNLNLDDLGQSIQDIVDGAVNSHDFQKLNETISHVLELGAEAVRKAADGFGDQSEAKEMIDPKELYASTGRKTISGLVKTICGGVFSLGTLSSFVSNVSWDVWYGSVGSGTIFSLAGLVISLWLTITGIRSLGAVKRFRIYRRTLGKKTQCTLEKLARSVGKNVTFVRKELRKMIDEGLFLQGHMDNEETCLITSDETYRHFEESRLRFEAQRSQEAAAQAQKAEHAKKQQTQSDTMDPQLRDVLNRGNAFVAEIRRCNDAIPGQEISEKISRMETIVQRIFQQAQAEPEIVPDLKKLMDYYLPMTVKLLNAYAEMDAQPIQGENIRSSKQEIEATLDTLNLAFEKLLDNLYSDTAMDVSSDISVLKTLLAQEGLTEDELSKMKK